MLPLMVSEILALPAISRPVPKLALAADKLPLKLPTLPFNTKVTLAVLAVIVLVAAILPVIFAKPVTSSTLVLGLNWKLALAPKLPSLLY